MSDAGPLSAPSLFRLDGGFSAGGAPPAEAVLERDSGEPSCSINPDALAAIRDRAGQRVREAIDAVYTYFPIDKSELFLSTMQVLTDGSICQALTARTGATEENHNEIREKSKSTEMSPEEGRRCGVIAMRFKPKITCDNAFFEKVDWKTLPFYDGVKNCRDIARAIDNHRMPVTLYAEEMTDEEAQADLSDLEVAPYYSRYANAGPQKCQSPMGTTDAFHSLRVSMMWPAVNFIMRGIRGVGWSGWMKLKSCQSLDGNTTYKADELMFNFGIRVFVPIDVEMDGMRATHTLIIDQIAATTTNSLARSFLSDETPYQRFIGGSFAKKLLLRATHKGWKIRKKR